MAETDKSQSATPERRRKAREQGQIARSREFGSVFSISGAGLTLWFLCSGAVDRWARFYHGLLETASSGDFQPAGPALFWSSIEVLHWIVPVLLVAMVLSVAVTVAQGGPKLCAGCAGA